MQRTLGSAGVRIAGFAATVCVMTACSVPPTGAQPSVPSSPTSGGASTETTAAAVTPTPLTAPSQGTAAVSAATSAVAASVAATRSVSAARIRYAAIGFDELTATAWSADVTRTPPGARGSAELLINGDRVPTDFEVTGGRLRVEGADGVSRDAGAAHGLLDPPELLDAVTGLAAVLASVTAPTDDPGPAALNGRPMVRVRGQIPVSSADLLLPAAVLGGAETLPVTLWLDPAGGNTLRQLIVTVPGGTVTVGVDPVTG